MTLEEIFEYTNIDPWFLNQLAELHQTEQWIKSKALEEISKEDFIQTKKRGFSDLQISRLTGKATAYSPSAACALHDNKHCEKIPPMKGNPHITRQPARLHTSLWSSA